MTRADTQTSTFSVGETPTLFFCKFSLRDLGRDTDAQVLTERRVKIGSSSTCTMRIDDASISREHCEIEVTEHGYLLRDLSSKNGTLVNGLHVVEVYLASGSVIELGDSRLEFRRVEEKASVSLWPQGALGKLIGPSVEMRTLFYAIDRVAAENVSVLIEGESGTGKELVAEEIQARSPRSDGPFVVLDCSAIPGELAESELFGHVKGSFTGAVDDRDGAFVRASGGTLFIDEVGELPLTLQPKLLRALESRRVRPVGGSDEIQCDVRVVAATNRNLADEVRKGEFRQDLYFRLNVVKLRLPVLRERRADIPALVTHFLHRLGVEDARISPDVLAVLGSHEWPGNVRELFNFVQRFKLFAPDSAHGASLLLESAGMTASAEGAFDVDIDVPYKELKGALVEKLEVAYFSRLLERHQGNLKAVADAAGLHKKYVEGLVRRHALK